MPEQRDDVAAESVGFRKMKPRWEILDDLRGVGHPTPTDAMRAAATKYLPRAPAEDPEDYQVRLQQSFLTPFYDEAIEDVVAKPYSRPILVEGNLPDPLGEIEDDVDRSGTCLTEQGRQVLGDMLHRGLSHVLVDLPEMVPGVTTAAQERALGIRPRFVHIPADRLFFWDFVVARNGEPVLTQIRYRATRLQRVGKFGQDTVEQIRVLNARPMDADGNPTGEPGTWEVWEKVKGKFQLARSGVHTWGQGLPLHTFYAKRTGFMEADPPFLRVGELNLQHWQAGSNADWAHYWTAFGMLFIAGATKEMTSGEKRVALGPNYPIMLNNPEAKASILESSGPTLTAQDNHVDRIEARARRETEQTLSRPAATATGEIIAEDRTANPVMAWVGAQQDGYRRCYELAVQWITSSSRNAALPDDFRVDINTNFLLGGKREDMASLIAMRAARDFPREQLFHEAQRRGIIAEGVTVEQLEEMLDQEAARERPPDPVPLPEELDDPREA